MARTLCGLNGWSRSLVAGFLELGSLGRELSVRLAATNLLPVSKRLRCRPLRLPDRDVDRAASDGLNRMDANV